jgi:eukaryotic-like serine/threonine-protein kinase
VTTADRPGAILNGVKPPRSGPAAPARSGPPHTAVLADRRRSSTDASKTLPLPALITKHPRIEPAGRVVAGRYRLRRLLGRGGMGAVWLAVDEALHRPVAVKQLVLSGLATDEERLAARARLLREARLAARVDHPGTVRVYDVAEDTGDPWIVTEALPGRTLEAALRDQGPLPVGLVISVGLCLLDALQATHRAGIVHRDVKPSNVQLCGGPRDVLTDFGIASTAEDGPDTSMGKIVGSPAYMSPEQVHGGEFEPASDLFSLGATLYAAVEGRSPFGKGCPVATLTAVVTDPPAPLLRAGPLGPVIEGLLAKDPARRLSTDQARRALRAIRRGESPRRIHVPRGHGAHGRKGNAPEPAGGTRPLVVSCRHASRYRTAITPPIAASG